DDSMFLLLSLLRRLTSTTLFPYTTLFRSPPGRELGPGAVDAGSARRARLSAAHCGVRRGDDRARGHAGGDAPPDDSRRRGQQIRSEEHTSELQSRENLVCRLLLEKKKVSR